jgi:multidrug efflux pump subunit AcrB
LSIATLLLAQRITDGRAPPLADVIDRLRSRLRNVHGIRAFFTPVQDLNLGIQASAARYQYTLWGPDEADVQRAREDLVARMRHIDGLIDVIGSWETARLQLGLVIDRDRAASVGVTPVAIDNTLYDAFGQRQLNTIYLRDNYSRVILETTPSRTGVGQLNDIYVPGAKGQVPLSVLT